MTLLDDYDRDEMAYGCEHPPRPDDPDAVVLCDCGRPLGWLRLADGYNECALCEERRLREDEPHRDACDPGIPDPWRIRG